MNKKKIIINIKMTDYEYEEENLDDFMINASSILSEDNNPDRNTILESLKQHLSSIFHIQNEMENFFNTLNGVIFTSKSHSSKKAQRIDNRQPFILYPIIFSFNPRTTSYFIDHYLATLQQTISEDNRPDFTFLSEVFADVVLAFFSDEKNNKYLIKKGFLLDQGKKKTIYDKILNFCNKNIKTNKKLEQSVGCLLLTEFIENCPLVKEDRNLDSLFKTISDYLDDRWFECKIDLLNCTISLIFAAEYKFKPYANICLFRVLDYLTDMDWMRRKLGINIVYTLVYYCKDEISTVKENVIEFLNTLKEDSIEEVREVCLHTLQILGEVEDDDENFDFEINNEMNKPKNVYNKYRNKNIGGRNKLNRGFERGERGESSHNNRSASKGKSQNKDRIKSKSPDNLMQKLKKEQDFLQKMEKDFNEKKKNFKANNYTTIPVSNNSNKSKISNKNYSASNTIANDNSQNKSKQNFKGGSQIDNNNYEAITTSINSIFDQLKKIQEDQIEFRQMLTNLKQTAGNNYLNLNERLRALEKSSRYGRNNQYQPNYYRGGDYQETRSQSKERRRPNIIFNKSDEKIKIEELKELFNNGKYNEAILETYQNDRYLLKLLPLIDKKIIPKIEIALLEDAISRLNKRLTILCMEGDRDSINDVLQFYIQLLKSKIELKLVTQLSINDALNFLRSKGSSILKEEDHHNIEKILGALRIEKD
jgi:hypothetical protein